MRAVYLQGRSLNSALGATLPEALAALAAGGKQPQRVHLPGGTDWPIYAIEHPEQDWRKRAQQLICAAAEQAGIMENATRLSVRGEPDGTTSHSTKPASGQVAGYVEPPVTGTEPFDKLRANGDFHCANSFRNAPLFIASSSLNIGAIELGVTEMNDSFHCAAEIAAWLGWNGPVYIVSSACTSAMQALLAARSMIASGAADDAVVLGIELPNRFSLSGFAAMQLLTPDRPKPLGAGRDGIALGEAVAALHLSARPARWRLRGGSNIVDGRDPTGAVPETVARMCELALADSGVTASDIGLIKLQAAGSPANDANELDGLAQAFGTMPPLVTLKAAIGHTLGASGAAEIALLTACLESGVWPQTAYAHDDELRYHLAPHMPPAPRYVLADILGFGGGHAAVILEDTRADTDRRP